MSKEIYSKDVLVVGAGPTGLSLAAALTRLNISVKIIEQKPGLSDTTKATNLMHGTQEQLAIYNLEAPMAHISGKMERMIMEGYGQNLGARTMHINESPFKDVLLLGQDNIERLLAQSLNQAGTQIDFDTKLISLTQDEIGVKATLKHGNNTTEEYYKYIVGCDGPWGVTRTFTSCNFEPVKTNRSIRQVDARLKWKRLSSMKQMWLFYFPLGFAVVVPLLDGYSRILTIEPTENIPDRKPTLDEMRSKLIEVTQDDSIELADAKWFSHANLSMGIAPGLIDRRVILAGDAGNPILPNGGQGLNTGIQDSLNLAWKLAAIIKANAPDTLLKTYESERLTLRAALEKVQFNSLKYTTNAPAFMQWAIRTLGNTLLDKGGEKQMAKAFSQLNVSYRKSELTIKSKKSKVPSGSRIMDADLVKATGLKEVSLFRELCTPYWKLIYFDAKQYLKEVGNKLTNYAGKSIKPIIITSSTKNIYNAQNLYYDIDELAHKVYDISGPTLLLVRPDNFIAARVPAADFATIDQYVKTWFK